ncbi:hypothetical protein CVT26_012318 [Gymnopilus dilepis]|uniref:Uncharacterized protein n=1 Tax=Gymnopilus dilepis TaxID=231916 RepID=A0A409YCK8_9AGAR|nr:hypothetical protein CVT26_012318 [Gymnopilus dilepis]
MTRQLKCLGCKSETFQTERGLSRHRATCGPYKRFMKKKVENFAFLAMTDNAAGTSADTSNEIAPVRTEQPPEFAPSDPVMEPVPSPPQEYRASGLPRRQTRLPRRYQDILPAPPPVITEPEPGIHEATPSPSPVVNISHKTTSNSYGIYRVYKSGTPSITPDDNFHLDSVADNPNFTRSGSLSTNTWGSPFGINEADIQNTASSVQHPFANSSVCRLMSWFYGGVSKTLKDLNSLVHNVLLAPDFKLEDLVNFDATKEAKKLDSFSGMATDVPSSESPPLKDGWIKGSVSIPLPCARFSFGSEADAPTFVVEDVYYRKPLDVIKEAFREKAAEGFHTAPYKEYWQSKPDDPPERIYSELYNTDAIKLARVDDEYRREAIETARRRIFMKGAPVNAKSISDLLGSTTPSRVSLQLISIIKYVTYDNQSAFSERLGPYGLNYYCLFVVDLLHEFELGVWKAVFTHLIRILYAQGQDAVQVLNERYRQMPTFGRDTIRKFCSNVSEMRKLAGRDFEDLLQCAVPAFEGLLDDKNNAILMDLLYELATWHSLAKLRLHTDSTLDALANSATRLGSVLRKFESTTCAEFTTKELPSEEAKRGRRKAAKAKKKGQTGAPMSEKRKGKQRATSTGPVRQRNFALSTYKLHCLADYPNAIRTYGTTDGLSSQIGEREHRRCKQFYPRVHKGSKHYTIGIAKHVRRERIIHNISQKNNKSSATKRPTKKQKKAPSGNPSIPFEEASEKMSTARPEKHYQMSDEKRHPVPIAPYLHEHSGDPAIKVQLSICLSRLSFDDFLPRLKDHLLARIRKLDYDGDETPFSDEERASVRFAKQQIYQHKVLRVNYTTYDMRREQDSLNPRTHANIMVLAHNDNVDGGHPYWYARIIGIYHALVLHPSSRDPIHMDFLWIRWYGCDPDPRGMNETNSSSSTSSDSENTDPEEEDEEEDEEEEEEVAIAAEEGGQEEDDEEVSEDEQVEEEMDFGYAIDEEQEEQEDEGGDEEELEELEDEVPDDVLGPEDGLDVDDELEALGYADP